MKECIRVASRNSSPMWTSVTCPRTHLSGERNSSYSNTNFLVELLEAKVWSTASYSIRHSGGVVNLQHFPELQSQSCTNNSLNLNFYPDSNQKVHDIITVQEHMHTTIISETTFDVALLLNTAKKGNRCSSDLIHHLYRLIDFLLLTGDTH